jgi:predicted oxidoreductase
MACTLISMTAMTEMATLELPTPFRPLYAGGPDVSSVAWGMWRFSGDDVSAAETRVNAALDAGVTLFDTADIYGPDNGEAFGAAEVLLGAVLKRAPNLKDRMVLATKGGIVMGTPYDSSRLYLTSAIDASLARMGVEHVALWQIHRPDMLTHPAEVARTLEDAQKAGKIGAIGVSNYTPAQVEALSAHLSTPIVSTQPEFSPLAISPLSDGILDQAMGKSMTVLAWSPFGGGRLGEPKDARAIAVAQILDKKASACGVSRAVAAYSWIMAHPAHPIPIVGTQTLARIAEIADVYTLSWTRSDWYDVLTASRGEALP